MANQRERGGDPADVRMIDVGGKPAVARAAVATGEILLQPGTIARIKDGTLEKGNVIVASKLAGVLAAKNTPALLPLCHPLRLTKVSVELQVESDRVIVTSEVKAMERTGVEMEALAATTAALLNVWDMTKMYEKDAGGQYPATRIQGVRVVSKTKGAPGGEGGGGS